MRPYLIDLGLFRIPSYGILFAGGVLLAWIWFTRRARSMDLPEEKAFNLAFYSLLGGIVGAKLLLILIDWRDYLADPALILGTLRTAGVLMGGVLGGAIVFIYYVRKHSLPVVPLLDAVVAPLALAQAFGRLGCFCAGCCYGKVVEHDHPLGVIFSNPDAIAHSRHATDTLIAVQPLEAGVDLLLVALLTWLWRYRPQPPGLALGAYLLLYGIARFSLEFLRGDSGRGLYFDGAVSTSQLFAVGGMLIGVVFIIRSFTKRS